MISPKLHRIDARPLSYLLSVPDVPPPIPVMCFLHGYDEAAPLEIRAGVTRHGPLAETSAAIATQEFIVLAPQLPRPGDIWSRYAETVRDLVERVWREHEGDPQRTFLTGFSFGGNGALDLGIGQQGLWAGLWPVDPTRVPDRAPDAPVWLSVGDAARPRAAGFRRALGLEDAGDPPRGDRLVLDQDEDHVGSARRAYADTRIYAWLLSKRLSVGAAP